MKKRQDYKTLFKLVGWGVDRKRTAELKKALADGLDPDSPNPADHQRTILFNNHLSPGVAKLLLAAGANASHTDANGFQPIHSTNYKVAALLLAAGADIEARFHHTLGAGTPLIAHAIRGDAKMVKFLLDHGADVLTRWNNYSNDVIGAAADSAHDPQGMGGRDKIYRLVERRIADGLTSRRFKLRSLKDVRR